MTPRRENPGTGCLACDLATGASPLPGGTIHRTQNWTVEHCVGPLGVGSLVVVQPVTEDVMRRFDSHGPALQVAMFSNGELPDAERVIAFSGQARSWFSGQGASHS